MINAPSLDHLSAQSLVVLQSLADCIGEGLVVVDEHGKTVLFNTAAEEILQMPMADATPDKWTEHYGLFLPDMVTPYPTDQLPLQKAMRGEAVDGTEIFVRHARAQEGKWILVTTKPWRDDRGVHRGGVAVFRDITDRKRTEEALRQREQILKQSEDRYRDLIDALRQSEHRFKSLFENLPIGAYRTTPDGRILNANPAMLRMLGYTSLEELTSRNLEVDELDPQYSRREFRERLEQEGEIRGLEATWKRRDNSFVFIRENARLTYDARGGMLYEGTAEDITERKKIEQIKDELISIVSHELRTPLTSIQGSLEYLKEKMNEKLPEPASRFIQVAFHNSKRMLRLINDLLDIDKIESGKMSFDKKPVSIRWIVEHSLEINQPYADRFGVRFVLDERSGDAVVYADSDRILQVLSNLLSNAAKFSPPNEVVVIFISRIDPNVQVSITDRGPGIPEAFRNSVFQKFAQGKPSRPEKGTGLGLSISKAIVEKHGGTIGFETHVSSGTTFYFELPLAGS